MVVLEDDGGVNFELGWGILKYFFVFQNSLELDFLIFLGCYFIKEIFLG